MRQRLPNRRKSEIKALERLSDGGPAGPLSAALDYFLEATP